MERTRALQILGLPESFSAIQLKDHFHGCLARYKADVLAHLGPSLKHYASERRSHIYRAHAVLAAEHPQAFSHALDLPINPELPAPADPYSISPIYDKDAIVSAPEDSDSLFIRGPFSSLEHDDARFTDPHVAGVDYSADMGREYISINSWKGRLRYAAPPLGLFPSTLYEIAELGGWDPESMCCEEVFTGGADIVTDYTCRKIARGIRNHLRFHPGDIGHQGVVLSRSLLLKACDILEAGPTTMPW